MNKKVNEDLIVKIWSENKTLTNQQKTDMYNEQEGTNFVPRTLYVRYNAHMRGLEKGIQESAPTKELEKLTEAKLKAMVEQKKVVMMKTKLHKDLRHTASMELLVEAARTAADKDVERATYTPFPGEEPNDVVIEYIIADLHYTGSREDQVNISKIFTEFQSRIDNFSHHTSDEHRVVLLGDLIEGNAAHKSQLLEVKTDMISQSIEVGRILTEEINWFFSGVKGRKTVADVIESNHSQLRLLNTGRGELKEDTGYFIHDKLKTGLSKDILIYPTINGKVETREVFYVHGDKGYMRNKTKFFEEFGTKKHVTSAHFHHLNLEEEKYRDVTSMPSAKINQYHYEDENGWKPTPQVVIRKLVDGKVVLTERIYL